MAHQRCFWMFTILLYVSGLHIFANESPRIKREIGKMYRWLSHTDINKREWACDRLILIGPTAVPYLDSYFSKSPYRVKRQILYVLGKIGDANSINLLFKALKNRDEGVRTQAASALLEVSDSYPYIENRIKALQGTNKSTRELFTDLKETLLFKNIERELDKLATPPDCFAINSKRFKALQNMGTKVVLPLLEIFSKDEYVYVHVSWNQSYNQMYKIRLLAGEALGVFANTMSGFQQALVSAYLRKAKNHEEVELQMVSICTLAQMGERAHFKKKIEEYKKKLRKNPRDAGLYFQVAAMYLRIRRFSRALRFFKRTIKILPNHHLAHYNLAGIYTFQGNASKAFFHLQKAVEYGFNDLQWLQQDKNLDKLRRFSAFQKIVRMLNKKQTVFDKPKKKYSSK